MTKDRHQDDPTGATPARPDPARRPYEPPTLIKRGTLSAMAAQTITPAPAPVPPV
jgi:hypothetical protein